MILEKQFIDNNIIITNIDENYEKLSLIEKRKGYQSKYGNKIKYCEYCDKNIKLFSWQNHMRSKKHLLCKQIFELKNENKII